MAEEDKTEAAAPAKTKNDAPPKKILTDKLPERLEKNGEKVQFRINEDGSVTRGWYKDQARRDPTSSGHKIEIKKVGVDHKVKIVDFGWWEEKAIKDEQGNVVERRHVNNIGAEFKDRNFNDVRQAMEFLVDWFEVQEKNNAKYIE